MKFETLFFHLITIIVFFINTRLDNIRMSDNIEMIVLLFMHEQRQIIPHAHSLHFHNFWTSFSFASELANMAEEWALKIKDFFNW